jgi:multiple sugar transport system permease protein
MMAAATLYTLPMIIIFFVAQKTFIQGVVTTGLK